MNKKYKTLVGLFCSILVLGLIWTHQKADTSDRELDLTLVAGYLPPPEAQRHVHSSQVTSTLFLNTERNTPHFHTKELNATAGEVIQLHFENSSDPQSHFLHAFVLVKPNMEKEVLAAATQAGPKQNFIPKSKHILARTLMLKPGEGETILFRAPSEPGDYPFFCPYPGHSDSMRGILHVSPR